MRAVLSRLPAPTRVGSSGWCGVATAALPCSTAAAVAIPVPLPPSACRSRSLHTTAAVQHRHDDWPQRSYQYFRELKEKELEEEMKKEAEAAANPVPFAIVHHPHPVPLPTPEADPSADADPSLPSALLHPPTHFAIFRDRGQQYKGLEEDLLMIDRLNGDRFRVGTQLVFEDVLLLAGRDATIVGRPRVHGAKIVATIEEHTMTAKVIVFKKKRRKGYKRKAGSRDEVTLIRINQILLPKGVQPLTNGSTVQYADEVNVEGAESTVKKRQLPRSASNLAAAASTSSSSSVAAAAAGVRTFSTLARSVLNPIPSSSSSSTSASFSTSASADVPPSHTNEQTIRDLLKNKLNVSAMHIEDTSGGCGSFFRLVVVSPDFDGKSLVQQHRLVNQTIKPHIANLHGLTLTTMTEQQWKERTQPQQ